MRYQAHGRRDSSELLIGINACHSSWQVHGVVLAPHRTVLCHEMRRIDEWQLY